jgi:hypothetical protein
MKSLILLTTVTALIMLSIVAIGGEVIPALACETNAKGCIEHGGPGRSGAAPPDVSGCHFFPPTAACARDNTPP